MSPLALLYCRHGHFSTPNLCSHSKLFTPAIWHLVYQAMLYVSSQEGDITHTHTHTRTHTRTHARMHSHTRTFFKIYFLIGILQVTTTNYLVLLLCTFSIYTHTNTHISGSGLTVWSVSVASSCSLC